MGEDNIKLKNEITLGNDEWVVLAYDSALAKRITVFIDDILVTNVTGVIFKGDIKLDTKNKKV